MTLPRITRDTMLSHALDIAEEYDGNLTLRQLYYQLVAQGFIANAQKEYNRLGDVLTQARLCGAFPLDWLMDRGRTVHEGNNRRQDSVFSAERWCKKQIRGLPERILYSERWYGQKTHVSVWVEKEALAGVFEGPCGDLGVGWFACKGYPSVSSLYQWTQQLGAAVRRSDSFTQAVVLYFGDHDPDGWEIPRAAERTVQTLQALAALEYGREQALAFGWDEDDASLQDEAAARAQDYYRSGAMVPVYFKRVALNMDQIRKYNPPPFPAKPSSSRYRTYVEEHGINDAWELDALKPAVLDQLIRDSVAAYFDADMYWSHQSTITARREELRDRMNTPGWFASAVETD